jgi:hypothetical protein
VSAVDNTNQTQFSAHWRNAETGAMEPVSDEVYAQKKAESKQRDVQRYEDSVRTSDHLFNDKAPKTYW